MSANLIVDLNGTCLIQNAWTSGGTPSGQVCGLSGIAFGPTIDLVNANTACNLVMNGLASFISGPLIVGVQTSDNVASGTFSDPTSGLQTLPSIFSSGGNLIIGSGSTGYTQQSGVSGTAMQSGWAQAAFFQRPQRYARILINSGFYCGNFGAEFISNLKQTGSGGGFSLLPGSGGINV